MSDVRTANESGEVLGYAAVDQVRDRAEQYSLAEKERITTANQPVIDARCAEFGLLVERRRDLKEDLRKAPPLGDLQSRRSKARYYWAVAIVLSLAGFFFSLLTFDPYRLGLKAYLYCVGIAIVTPFLVDKFLDLWASPRLVRALATGACAAAIVSLMLLAVIRGDVLSQQMETSNAPVVVDDAPAVPDVPQQPNFYKQTLGLLRLVMALLALALEVGAGLAVFEARRLASESGEDPKMLMQELAEVQGRMVQLVHEIRSLENAPDHFENQFWSDFYRAMLKGTARNGLMRTLWILPVAALLLVPSHAAAGTRLNLVIGIDLTSSVSSTGPDNRSDFEKNVAAVAKLLGQCPAGSHVTIFGITDRTFSQPYLLLSAQVSPDEGYFKERVASARSELVKTWHVRAARLTPSYKQSDVLGGLVVASQLRETKPDTRNVLVIFSDMRHMTRDLDLEHPKTLLVGQALRSAERARLVTNLDNVDVYVAGADGTGRSVGYWQTLKEFWTEYFRRAHANLKLFSVTRDPQF